MHLTFDELYSHILTVCPYAQMGEDSEGQLVIHTDMREENGRLIHHAKYMERLEEQKEAKEMQ